MIGCVAVLSALLALLAGPASGQDCTQPFPPVFFQRGYPFNDPPPALNAAPVSITPNPLAVFAPGEFSVDFDGDGTPDYIRSGPPTAAPTVKRPGGNISFARAGKFLEVAPVGNLDGEPGQEIWVWVAKSDNANQYTFAAAAYVVPYGAPAGTHDPADVGIRVPPGAPWALPDRTGDGVAEVLDFDSVIGGTTRLLSGAKIVSASGRDARREAVLATIPGAPFGVVDFGDDPPVVVTADQNAGSVSGIHVFDGSMTTSFSATPAAVIPSMDVVGSPSSHLRAAEGGDGQFITFSGQGRNHGGTYTWSLDGPCSSLSAAGAGGPGAATTA